MASPYKSDGVNFDNLFDPDIVGDGPTASRLRADGDLFKYAAIKYGSKRTDVGFRMDGVDVSNLWAKKGTAQYVSSGGVPVNMQDFNNGNTGPRSASYSVTYKRNGTVAWLKRGAAAGSGTWAPGGSTIGDAYDIRYTLVSGSITGASGAWQRLNADHAISVAAAASVGSATQQGRVRVEIRERSSGAVKVSYEADMVASVTIFA